MFGLGLLLAQYTITGFDASAHVSEETVGARTEAPKAIVRAIYVSAIAGFFLALNIASVAPASFEPIFTFFGYAVLILGGLASYWGLIGGSLVLWGLIEGTRAVELVESADDQAALRFMLIGLLIILLMAFRPQGMFGKKEEMVLGD